MSTIQLRKDYQDTTTSVSNVFIDRFMPEANGEFVKVYLYLLRHLTGNADYCTISAIADQFNHTEADVIRALKYWERMQILRLEYNSEEQISGIVLLNVGGTTTPTEPTRQDVPSNSNPKDTGTASDIGTAAAKTANASANHTPPVNATSNVVSMPSAKKEYTLDEIQKFQANEAISELFFIIETYLKHPLSSTDANTVLYWYDSLHFPADLIIYLVEYCISKGHSSLRYMDKVALGWSESHIKTVEQAKENAAIHSQAYYSVMKAFGITGRNLVDGEIAFIRRWTKEYNFDLPLILEACKRTIAATHQPSFEYADSILTNWHNNNVHTPDDIAALDQAYNRNKRSVAPAKEGSTRRNKFNNFTQRDNDYDQLEKMLLTTSVQ